MEHGRQIDADIPVFSVDLLRGLKRYREEMARREFASDAGITGLIGSPY